MCYDSEIPIGGGISQSQHAPRVFNRVTTRAPSVLWLLGPECSLVLGMRPYYRLLGRSISMRKAQPILLVNVISIVFIILQNICGPNFRPSP